MLLFQKSSVVAGLLSFLCLQSYAQALPQAVEAATDRNIRSTDELLPRAVARGTLLRIMPLGASITSGYGSTDGNGYRQILKDRLVKNGNPVHFVGTQRFGSMPDNETEAYGGLRIEQVQAKMTTGVSMYKPNLVLILLGSNDCGQNYDVPNAANRMGTLVDAIFALVPNTFIIVAKIPPNGNAATEANVKIYNKGLDTMAAARPFRRLKVWNMHDSISVKTDLLADGLHPNDSGYMKLAGLFYDAVLRAGGKISPVVKTSYPDTT